MQPTACESLIFISCGSSEVQYGHWQVQRRRHELRTSEAAGAWSSLDSLSLKRGLGSWPLRHAEPTRCGAFAFFPFNSLEVALYGALCALASLDRSEVQRLLDSQTFRECLDMAPYALKTRPF